MTTPTFDDDDDEFTDLGAKRCITPLDLQRVISISDAQVSRDGRRVVFVHASLDASTMTRRRALYVANLGENNSGAGGVRQLTAGPDDSSPAWSGDSLSVAFVRAGQVCVIAVDGGEAVVLTKLHVDVAHLLWSPRGDAVAFCARVALDDASFHDTSARDAECARRDKWRVYDDLMVRAWDEYVSVKRSHLFVAPLERDPATGHWRLAAPPRDLMAGVDADCPTHATFGGREQIAFSPDGARLAFACKYRTADAAWSVSTTIHVVSLAGDEHDAQHCASHAFVAALTLESDAVDNFPAFSPDGSHLAWLSSLRPGNEADRLELMLHRIGSATARRLSVAAALDVSIAEFVWLTDSRIAFAADHQAHRKLFLLDGVLDDATAVAAPRALTADGHVSGLQAVPGGDAVVAVHSSFTSAPELIVVGGVASGGAARTAPLTALNAPLLAALDLAQPRSLSVVGHNGAPIQVWLVTPPRAAMRKRAAAAAARGVKLPLLLLAHGGPQGCWDSSWHTRWNVQVWAALGFVCVVPNFTGSTGFGQAFVDAISKNWDVAAKDCLLAVDAVAEQFDFVDGAQQFCMGASFGGWLTLYLNGAAPGRFTALVAHDGVFDTKTMYYQTDELFFVENEFGIPTADNSTYQLMSPSSFVERWQTPVLLMHGARDFRCPLGESLAAFAAARRRGIKARLCISDESNHWVVNPETAVQWHNHIREWLAEFSSDVLEW
jgi:dipeptidyl aminopeptidase/acylaminoacyl peptidase